jgi:quinol monooxygenase YgiN
MKSARKLYCLALSALVASACSAAAAPVVEQITFRTKPRVTRAALLAAIRATDEEMKREPGFVSRQLLVDEKGTYTLVITWQSLAAAQRAEESEADTPAARAANALIDDKSATLRRAEVLLPVVP